ncbi:uncharacterized protein BXIN_2332 [Babesia sp. Xinjiang]|uniref:uncharacterized protein n=1 Tax=Babesia sp. Xinjiang TaxID=462227 RepID=UPI000A218B4E|nr:uncharacterized protein BXIN_2332 [Babesia sp. Xinjiang]ORM40786.1 putative membrane protein [Babesia sp. Xinjiang]
MKSRQRQTLCHQGGQTAVETKRDTKVEELITTATIWATLPRAPFLRGYVHLLLALFSPALIAWLFLSVVNKDYFVEYVVAFVCCILNFVASATLHYTVWELNSLDICLKADYAFIFLMIGGSAVPATVAVAKDDFSVLTALIQWIGISMGTVGALAFRFVTASPALRVIVYFAVGSPYVRLCCNLYNMKCFVGLLFSCMTLAVYMLGGVVYAKRAPNPIPKYLGFHEVFHLCCALALVTTFIGNHKITNFVDM